MLTQLDCGIRPNEALQLKISDFDFKHYCVIVPEKVAKTRHSRTLSLSIETVRAITKLINYRPSDWKNDIPVFCSCEGETLCSDVMSRRFAKYSQKLDVYITPYAMRHCFALYYLRNGGGSLHLQRLMSHESLDMCRKYARFTNLIEQESTVLKKVKGKRKASSHSATNRANVQKHKVKLINIAGIEYELEINNSVYTKLQNENKQAYQRHIEAWTLRGHIRHYKKTGKEVLIKPYKKGHGNVS